MSDDMLKWIDDPFEKLDRAGSEATQTIKDALEAKIAEYETRKADMDSLFPQEISNDDKMRNTAALKSPMGEVLKEFAYPMHDAKKELNEALAETADGPWGDPRERKLQQTITNIHAVAKHLFHIDGYDDGYDVDELFVGVQPLGNMFRVEVTYAGFTTTIKEPTLTEALEKMLAKLMTHVSRRLEEAMRITAALDP